MLNQIQSLSSVFNFHVINACWSCVPRMRKEPGYGTSRVAVARAVLLPVAFASDLNYQGATTRAMLCRLCCCAMCCHVFITLTNWLNDFKHLLKAKAYVWDVSLPFVFCLCRLATFHCWCSLLASDIIPLTTCWYFRLYTSSWIPSQFCWWRIGRSLVAAPRYGSASNLLLAPSFLQEWESVKSALWESQCCQNKLNCYSLGTGRCLDRYLYIYTFRITLGT